MLLLVVMGIFDFGRGIYYYSAVDNAAREGARYGAIDHCNTVAIQDAAKSYAGDLGTSFMVDTPTIYWLDGQPQRIVVTVRFNFRTVTPLIGNFLGEDGSIMLESQARQLIELWISCP